ncbi:MAG: phage shock protein operon transcriptional activator [Rhodospirillales bacterium]|jgi:psp operon transcriptional activator|nr:phage shock protein operon transcriptional activator [Rhodospirillales bacterium]
MPGPTTDLPPLIGESSAFLEMMEAVSLAAPLNRPALVIGERGTGKELIAARLHFLSARWGRPLIKLNCASLPETLLETELFGHEAGAFTGAVRRRMGRFERADGGSLFLDEIANASQAVQEKILRVVEYGEMERVGGSEAVRVDVRVIAATNVDLPGEAAAGRFRHDLLDRLAFEVLTIPPLRHRPEDIPLLATFFARAMARELDWNAFPGFTPAASASLMAYFWPGNVREIKNVAERAVYRWPDETTPIDDIQFDPFASPYRPGLAQPKDTPAEPSQSPNLREAMGQFEVDMLETALEANRYNQRATARHLGLTYDQLRNRLRKYGINEAEAQKSRSA